MPSLANLSMRGVGIVPPYTPKAPQPMLSTKMKTMLGLRAVDPVAIEALLSSTHLWAIAPPLTLSANLAGIGLRQRENVRAAHFAVEAGARYVWRQPLACNLE